MANEQLSNDVRNVWQSQETEGAGMSLEEIRNKARTLQSKVGRRNRREYIAVVLVVLGYGFYIYHYHSFVIRLGSMLVIAGTLYVAYQLHKRASARELPEDCGFECCVDFHRRGLERQRDALGAVWSWYLGPLVPGLVVFFIGTVFRPMPSRHGQHPWIALAISLTVCSLVFLLIGRLNRSAARGLQRQIDELNAAAGPR